MQRNHYFNAALFSTPKLQYVMVHLQYLLSLNCVDYNVRYLGEKTHW